MIDHFTMTDHVLRAALESLEHVNTRMKHTNTNCTMCLLVPHGDSLLHKYQSKRQIIEGPENDVLQRYIIAMHEYNPDYVVRITGDCPLIAPSIITKHITCAVNNQLDYCSNVYENARTFVDGYDCEVISKRMMFWTAENAMSEHDREHVTTYIRRNKPEWAKYGAVVGHVDLSDVKLSVDTKDELENARWNKRSIMQKMKALKDDGISIYRF